MSRDAPAPPVVDFSIRCRWCGRPAVLPTYATPPGHYYAVLSTHCADCGRPIKGVATVGRRPGWWGVTPLWWWHRLTDWYRRTRARAWFR